jgi:hypothetical protein
MILCDGCNRYHMEAGSCPFCTDSPRSRRVGLGALVMGALTPVVLAACYGAPPTYDSTDSATPVDLDGDSFTADQDCDDTDDAVYPGAVEDCGDGIDNDCDTLIDDADPDCTAR